MVQCGTCTAELKFTGTHQMPNAQHMVDIVESDLTSNDDIGGQGTSSRPQSMTPGMSDRLSQIMKGISVGEKVWQRYKLHERQVLRFDFDSFKDPLSEFNYLFDQPSLLVSLVAKCTFDMFECDHLYSRFCNSHRTQPPWGECALLVSLLSRRLSML